MKTFLYKNICTNLFFPLVSIGLIFFALSYVHAAAIEIEWDKPEAEINFDGYKIYYVEDSPEFEGAEVITVDNPNQTSVEIDGLLEGGVYYLSATTYKVGDDGHTLESERSGAMTYLVPGEYSGDGETGLLPEDVDAVTGGGGGGGGGCFIKASTT